MGLLYGVAYWQPGSVFHWRMEWPSLLIVRTFTHCFCCRSCNLCRQYTVSG